VEGAIVRGVGSPKTYTSKKDGSVYLPLNQNFPLSPISIVLIGSAEIFRYVNTDEALAAKDPVILEIDERKDVLVEAHPTADACQPKIDSWSAGISEDGAGLSYDERSAIRRIIDNTQLECEEQLQQIVNIAFTPAAIPGTD
jgi:hypothetical protein